MSTPPQNPNDEEKATVTVVEVTVAAPADVVWHALRDRAALRRWFGWDYADLDAETEFIFFTHAEPDPETLTVAFGSGDTIQLDDLGDRTVVRVTRAASALSAGTTGDDWRGIYDDITDGWITFVEQLRFTLERHPADERRTLFASGLARTAGTTPSGVLGLDGAAGAAVGSRYEAASPVGDLITGQVWFSSRHQLGLTVDGYGGALLVLHHQPEAARPPHGGLMLVLTTYGLDDAAFADLAGRWLAHLRTAYDEVAAEPASLLAEAMRD